MSFSKIKVIILDDHALIRAGMRSVLENSPMIEVVGEGSVGDHLEPLVRQHKPDVVLLDLLMPQKEGNGIRSGAALFQPASAIKAIRRVYPHVEFVIVTQESHPNTVISLANAGAKGYLLKDDALSMELVGVVISIHNGSMCVSPEISRTLTERRYRISEEELTPRHIEILQYYTTHANDMHRDVAEALHISDATLKKHMSEIRQRLRVKTTTAAVLKAVRIGIIPISAISFPED